MKTFSQFMKEAKEIVKQEPQTVDVDKEILRHPDVTPVIHGVYEEITDLAGDTPVHEYLKNHEDGHGLIKGIMGKMGSMDQEAIEQYRLTDPGRIAGIHHILSQEDYLPNIVTKFQAKHS